MLLCTVRAELRISDDVCYKATCLCDIGWCPESNWTCNCPPRWTSSDNRLSLQFAYQFGKKTYKGICVSKLVYCMHSHHPILIYSYTATRSGARFEKWLRAQDRDRWQFCSIQKCADNTNTKKRSKPHSCATWNAVTETRKQSIFTSGKSISAHFSLHLVTMATPFAPLKIQMVYLIRWFTVQISRGGAKIKVGSLDLGLYGQLMCSIKSRSKMIFAVFYVWS